ncbi:MAG: aldo/keto reductase [Clostridiales Family XIII bacterium]|jgi:aryl-alcohol dehydrogenase-like predicted oxidoreductase/ferredoxin|nr:aldo/keto reductase [Clostridiales Family XIII bacterium]
MDMKKHELGRSGIMVTSVGMGVLSIGRTQLDLPLAEGADVVGYALDRGINFLDTAEWYQTYKYIAEALRTRRGAAGFTMPVVASKSLETSYDAMAAAIDDMRRDLDLDVIDIFLLHEVRQHPDFANRAGAWECLNEMKAKGAVKAIGISTHYTDVAELNVYLTGSDVIFPLINKNSLGIRRGEGFGTKEDMAAAIARNSAVGKGVFTMKAFGGGNLTGEYRACLDYVSALPGVDSVMVGLGARREVDDLVAWAEGRLDLAYAPDISHKRIRVDEGDCEGCGVCARRCPNGAIHMNEYGVAKVDHEVCLTCGYCAPACPVRAIIMY